jgi:hypothetical protein
MKSLAYNGWLVMNALFVLAGVIQVFEWIDALIRLYFDESMNLSRFLNWVVLLGLGVAITSVVMHFSDYYRKPLISVRDKPSEKNVED